MQKSLAVLAAFAAMSLGGCSTTNNFTPMERYLNRSAAAQVAATNCMSGGYGDVAKMRADADANLAQARAAGATEADIEAARKRMNERYATGVFLVGPAPTCNSLVNELAWVGTTPVASTPAGQEAVITPAAQ